MNPVAKKGSSALALAVVFALLISGLGIVGMIAIEGVRRFQARAQTDEAKLTLAQISRHAVTAYQDEHMICPSASAAVPADATGVRSRRFQSSPEDWSVDESRHAGFSCLKFDMTQPQHYQYIYEATPTSFVATAHGDLDGDGKRSTFQVRGQIVGDAVVIAPQVLEIDPEE